MPSAVVHVGSEDALKRLCREAGDAPVVIDFSASWCGPCRTVAPMFEKMSTEFPGVKFAKVDIDECQELALQYSVSAVPTFTFLVNGKQVESQVRGGDIGKVRTIVEKLSQRAAAAKAQAEEAEYAARRARKQAEAEAREREVLERRRREEEEAIRRREEMDLASKAGAS
eukprot:tig00021428_g21143.t1